MKKALLVGINDYPQQKIRLAGCAGDARRMKELLCDRYGFSGRDVVTLLNGEATRAEIERRLEWLCEGARAGDVRVFYYAGHGSLVPDRSGDEPDGQDEALVPFDHDQTGMLIDDDLGARYDRVEDGCNLTLIMDCCHSGTDQRPGVPGAVVRAVPPDPSVQLAIDEARRKFERDSEAFVREALAGKGDYSDIDERRRLIAQLKGEFERKRRHTGNRAHRERNLLLAACEPRQLSAEAMIGDRFQGAFTCFLLQAIRALGAHAPASRLVQEAQSLLREAKFSQTPQLEGRAPQKGAALFAPLA